MNIHILKKNKYIFVKYKSQNYLLMKTMPYKKVPHIIMFYLSLLLFTNYSCVDNDYDLSKGLSDNMHVGGDSLIIPVGATDTIKVSQLLEADDIDLLKILNDGGYGFVVNDSFKVNIEKINTDDVNLDRNFVEKESVSLNEFDISNIIIKGITQTSTINTPEINADINVTIPNNMPDIKPERIDVSGYELKNKSIDAINAVFDSTDILKSLELAEYPGDDDNNIIQVPNDSVNITGTASDSTSFTVPEGVSHLDTIYLENNEENRTRLNVTFEIINFDGTFKQGTITPNVTIDPSDFFVFSDNTKEITITEPLTAENGYKITSAPKYINAFYVKNKLNSDGKIKVNVDFNGRLELTGLETTAKRSGNINTIGLRMRVLVDNIVIESMNFYVDKINAPGINETTPISINNILLPEEVKEVKSAFTDNQKKYLEFTISADNLPEMIKSNENGDYDNNGENKGLTINSLAIQFPDKFVFENISGVDESNKYTLSDFTFSKNESSKTISLPLKQINFDSGNQADGTLSFKEDVSYTSDISFEGRMNSKNIKSPQLTLGINSDIVIDKVEIVTKDINKELENQSFDININAMIDEMVQKLNNIGFTNDPKLRVNIDVPNETFDINANPVTIKFPETFKFKENPNLDQSSNTYTMNGDIETPVILTLDSLRINKELVNGRLILNNKIDIRGNILLPSKTVLSDDINKINNDSIKINTEIDDMKLASAKIDLNTIADSVEDATNIEIREDLPDEIIGLDSIILEDNAKLKIKIEINGLPDMTGNKLFGNAKIKLPYLIKTKEGETNEDNVWVINNEPFEISKAKNGKDRAIITKELDIRSFRFNNLNIDDSLIINDSANYTVKISMVDPSIETSQLQDLNTDVTVSLDNMKLKYVYGLVDPVIDTERSTVEIDDVPDFMKEDSVRLDIANPVLKLSTNSNIGVPVNAGVVLSSYVNGEISDTVKLNLSLDKATIGSTKEQKFWIASTDSGMEANYEYIHSEIKTLFNKIPDSIAINVDAETEKDQQHEVDLSKDFKLSLDYDVTVPLSFGKELRISDDTIIEVDKDIADMISGSIINVTGYVYNTIPLKLNLVLTPLDKDSMVIETAKKVTQDIKAGEAYMGEDGKYKPVITETELDMQMENSKGEFDDMRYLRIQFIGSASSSTETTAPLKPDDYIYIKFNFVIPGGLNVGNIINDDDKE